MDDEPSWVDFIYFELLEFMVFLSDTKVFSMTNNGQKLLKYNYEMMNLKRLRRYLKKVNCIDRVYDFYLPKDKKEEE